MKNFDPGQIMNKGHYKCFEPNAIHRKWEITDMETLHLLSLADRQIGRLDTFSEYVNIDLFIGMHISKEATQSSKIEGTQTNIQEVFMNKDDIALEKRDDWQEVQNYIAAMNEAIKMLHTFPFSSRLIKQTHKILLQSTRGENKLPGEYRSSQNWIGGATLNDAIFIPPHHSSINNLMSDLEKFANDGFDSLPDLMKIALIHYQFETIHPFLDGNGRVGRLLITLYLVSKGILKKPILYLSDFFEKNKELYYGNLMRVRNSGDINQWLKFFLSGIIETAKSGVTTFDQILKLQKQTEKQTATLGLRSTDANKVIEYLYDKPIIDAIDIAQIINKTPKTAYKLIEDLEKLEILKNITGAQRGRNYCFAPYLELFID